MVLPEREKDGAARGRLGSGWQVSRSRERLARSMPCLLFPSPSTPRALGPRVGVVLDVDVFNLAVDGVDPHQPPFGWRLIS